MKKYLLCLMVGSGTLLNLGEPSQAQFYSSYTYNNNAYLNYAIASQKAKATGRKARVSSKTRHKRRGHSVKRSRRYSKR